MRKEAALQAELHHLGTGLTLNALAASFDNNNETGKFVLAIVMPRMQPLPPLASLTLEKRLQIVQDVSETVAALHALPDGWVVLHRDIKPENFLVGKDGRVYLGDFGEALRLASDASHPQGSTVRGAHGTCRYMDPALHEEGALSSKVCILVFEG